MATRNPYAEHKIADNGGYLKFEDKKPVAMRIVSDPIIFDNEYKGRYSTKYAFLVYNITESAVQIMQLPKTGFRALAAIAADEDYGNPMENDYVVKITRTGEKQQTKYDVVPSPKKFDITEDIQAEIDAIDLKKRIEASPNNSDVAWLLEEVDGKRTKTDHSEMPTGGQKDVVIEDVDEDEPINLDDIDY